MINRAVDAAIARIWEGYSEPLSLADIAKMAFLSRFHFCRVFREATGVSPGRFLSAVRIYHAKRLLASTSLSVTEISFAVGYNSLGSFTNRFTESVGASPTRFRHMCREGIHPIASVPSAPSGQQGTVTGTLSLPPEYIDARIYIGAFETPIMQRRPLSWTIVEACDGETAPYRLPGVEPGEWFISAVATADSKDPEPWTRRSLLVGRQGPVAVTAGAVVEADITLRPRSRRDLPILFAVPDLVEDVGDESAAQVTLPQATAAVPGC